MDGVRAERGTLVNCGPDPSSSADPSVNPAAIQQRQQAEAASIAQQRAQYRAQDAASRFDSSRDDIHKRLDDVAALAERESWTEALHTGDAMQRDLSPLFRSSIGDTQEVVAIRTRLDELPPASDKRRMSSGGEKAPMTERLQRTT